MFHPNAANYKYVVINKETAETKYYLNAKQIYEEYGITHGTFYRMLGGKYSRLFYKKFLFLRCRVAVT